MRKFFRYIFIRIDRHTTGRAREGKDYEHAGHGNLQTEASADLACLRAFPFSGLSVPEEILSELSYRWPLAVTQVRQYANGESFCVCPRCRASLDREYTAYCDRCGQKLSW